MPGPRLTILSSTRICARSSETGAAQTGPRVVGRRLCHLRPRRRLVLFGVGESSLPTASDEMLSTLPPAPARHSKLYNTPLSSHDTITVMLKLVRCFLYRSVQFTQGGPENQALANRAP